MLITETAVLFYGCADVFSNWYGCQFKYDGHSFKNSEQALMYAKASLFKCSYSISKTLKTPDPYKVKKIGRGVSNFDDRVWISRREQIMSDILFCKFSQDDYLKECLIATGDRLIIEASPYDKIWGIGMYETEDGAANPSNWNGLNLLGKCLMNVRNKLK